MPNSVKVCLFTEKYHYIQGGFILRGVLIRHESAIIIASPVVLSRLTSFNQQKRFWIAAQSDKVHSMICA